MAKAPFESVTVVYRSPVNVFVAVILTPGSGTPAFSGPGFSVPAFADPALTVPRIVPPAATVTSAAFAEAASGCAAAAGWLAAGVVWLAAAGASCAPARVLMPAISAKLATQIPTCRASLISSKSVSPVLTAFSPEEKAFVGGKEDVCPEI
jgi:hypothetical protein